jgi:hypothetical protein
MRYGRVFQHCAETDVRQVISFERDRSRTVPSRDRQQHIRPALPLALPTTDADARESPLGASGCSLVAGEPARLGVAWLAGVEVQPRSYNLRGLRNDRNRSRPNANRNPEPDRPQAQPPNDVRSGSAFSYSFKTRTQVEDSRFSTL